MIEIGKVVIDNLPRGDLADEMSLWITRQQVHDYCDAVGVARLSDDEWEELKDTFPVEFDSYETIGLMVDALRC